MRNMIDLRFGPGTWQSIVDLRAKRIREAREAAEQARRERIRKQKQFNEQLTQGAIAVIVCSGMAAALVFLIFVAS